MTTLIREMQNDNVEGRKAEARTVTRRFIRSVARIFVVLNIEMTPATNKKKRQAPLFNLLPMIALIIIYRFILI